MRGDRSPETRWTLGENLKRIGYVSTHTAQTKLSDTHRNGVADYDTRNSTYYFNLGQCFGVPLAFLGAALALAGYAGRRRCAGHAG